jgi:hypothetical protein
VSPNRIAEVVEPERCADLDAALVRYRAPDARGEPDRVEGREPRRDRPGRNTRPIRPDRARHRFQRQAGAWTVKRGAPTTATSRRSGITRCSCSMTTGTLWRRSCGRATSPARTTGRNSWCQRWTASGRVGYGWRSAPMPPSQGRRSTTRWKHAASCTPSASRPTRTWSL